MWHRIRHPKHCELLVCDTLSIVSFFRITRMWYWNTQILCTRFKKLFLHINNAKNHRSPEMPTLRFTCTTTCMSNITWITAHTTMLPTRYHYRKTRVHTGFDLDSFGQETPSLFLVKASISTSLSISVTSWKHCGMCSYSRNIWHASQSNKWYANQHLSNSELVCVIYVKNFFFWARAQNLSISIFHVPYLSNSNKWDIT